jgi:hypothetical protein
VKRNRPGISNLAQRPIDAAMGKPDEGDRDGWFVWHDDNADMSCVEIAHFVGISRLPVRPWFAGFIGIRWRLRSKILRRSLAVAADDVYTPFQGFELPPCIILATVCLMTCGVTWPNPILAASRLRAILIRAGGC